MAIRKYKPTTRAVAARRWLTSPRSLDRRRRSRCCARSRRPVVATTRGRITTRHIGGGHKRQYRVIDFRRNDKDGVNAKVAHIEYDPNRTARIALLHYFDGEKRYILAPAKLKQGDIVESGAGADIKPGNNLPLKNIPTGTVIHAIELRPGGGAKMARSAGASVRLVAKDGPYAQLRPSLGRDPQRRCALPRDHRRGRQRRAVEHQLGQGRPHALEGRPPDRAWCRDEPGGPPARWW